MANKSTTYYRYLQQQQEEQKTNDIYINFVNSLDSSASRMAYLNAFEQFMRFCNMHSYEQMLELAKSGEEGTTKILESKIRDFIIWLREDVKRSQSTVMIYSAAISHFYQMNDVIINWKKLKKFKGKMRNVVQDVPIQGNK